MRNSKNLENKTASDTFWRVQLVCKKIQAHSSLESPLEYNLDHMPSRRETGTEIPDSSRLEFLQKFSGNKFALSDAEDNTSRFWIEEL